MNPWLLTWAPFGDSAKESTPNLIAGVLHNRTSERDVVKFMQFILAGHSAWCPRYKSVRVSELVRFAKRDYPYPVSRGMFPEFCMGSNPMIVARQVFNLKVSYDDDGNDHLEWEENVYPHLDTKRDIPKQINDAMPFPRRHVRFSSITNTITISHAAGATRVKAKRKKVDSI